MPLTRDLAVNDYPSSDNEDSDFDSQVGSGESDRENDRLDESSDDGLIDDPSDDELPPDTSSAENQGLFS